MTQRVAVIGGSIAGLHAAACLARANVPVSVFEANGHRPLLRRSLIATSAYREMLGSLGEPAVVNEINRFELFAGGGTTVVSLRRPDLIIERAVLLRGLEADALAAGVEIHHRHKLMDLRHAREGTVLRFANGLEARADVVVGADGWRSTVARSAGMAPPRVVPLVQAIVDLPPNMRRDSTRVWFVPEDTSYFYWLIPDSETTGALGIIGDAGVSPRALLDAFARREQLRVREYQGARIPEYSGWRSVHRRFGSADIYLVGDAAGHVKVTTVGGLVNGLWGARGVVDAIVGGTSGRSRHLASLRRELGLHLLIRKAMHRFSSDDYRQLLDMLDVVAIEQLGQYGRDETLRLMTRLLARRPQLVLLGLRGLLSSLLHASPRQEAATAR